MTRIFSAFCVNNNARVESLAKNEHNANFEKEIIADNHCEKKVESVLCPNVTPVLAFAQSTYANI